MFFIKRIRKCHLIFGVAVFTVLTLAGCSSVNLYAPQNRYIVAENISLDELDEGEAYVWLTTSYIAGLAPRCDTWPMSRFEIKNAGVLDRSDGIIFYNDGVKYDRSKSDITEIYDHPSYIHIFKADVNDGEYQVGDFRSGAYVEVGNNYKTVTLIPGKINYLGHLLLKVSPDCKKFNRSITNELKTDLPVLIERYGADRSHIVLNLLQ